MEFYREKKMWFDLIAVFFQKLSLFFAESSARFNTFNQSVSQSRQWP